MSNGVRHQYGEPSSEDESRSNRRLGPTIFDFCYPLLLLALFIAVGRYFGYFEQIWN